MKTLLCSIVFIFSVFIFSVQTLYAVCGQPHTIRSEIGQTTSSVYGYSETKINPCAALYYDLPKVESTLTESYASANGTQTAIVSQGQHQSYTVSYSAIFNHNYSNPISQMIYSVNGIHSATVVYQVYEEYSGGWYWYDPYQVGSLEGGNGGWIEYSDPFFGNVTYWVNIPISLGVTSQSLVYQGVTQCQQGQQFTQSGAPCNYQPPPVPPFDPITGCAAGYTSLGAAIASNPTAEVINNRVVVFARGFDNRLYYQYSSGGNFSGWNVIPQGGTYEDPMSTVINGTMYLEVQGGDGNRYYVYSNDGVNFSQFIQGSVGAYDKNPSVDFNGFIYDFGQGEQVAQPHLCVEQSLPTSLSTVEFEPINSLLDLNPKYGAYPLTDGLRIFPDKTTPTDPIDRTKVRVKATVFPAQAGQKIYFKTYDMDDPSFDVAPVDDNGNLGNDNRGYVGPVGIGTNGLGKAGQIGCPVGTTLTVPAICSTSNVNLGYAKTDANGIAVMELEVTKQPGDNFAVAVGQATNYLNNTKPIGADLKNGAQNVPTGIGTTLIPSNAAVRTQMLTVWRRLHIEVDRMANVTTDNHVTGQITSASVNSDGRTTYDVLVNPSLEERRFDKGRIVIGNVEPGYQVYRNTSNTITLVGNPSGSTAIPTNASFTIYDDDDYNDDFNINGKLLNGDSGEQILPIPESLKYIKNEDGLHPNLKPLNVFANAYIKPEYDWAVPFNDTIPFSLNVEDTDVDASTPNAFLNQHRGSKNSEGDDFWVVYLILAYQGQSNKDGDGYNIVGGINRGDPFQSGFSVFYSDAGDCYKNISCLGTNVTQVPSGGVGSLIYQEVIRDANNTYALANAPIDEQGTIAPHEIGHQFGLLGDNKNNSHQFIFKIMDYATNNETLPYEFHPEHINLMRYRVKSPGQLN